MPSQTDIDEQEELLEAYRGTLSHYLKQRARLGGEAQISPGIANGIIECRSHIRRIKEILLAWGGQPESHPNDEDPVDRAVTATLKTPAQKAPQEKVSQVAKASGSKIGQAQAAGQQASASVTIGED